MSGGPPLAAVALAAGVLLAGCGRIQADASSTWVTADRERALVGSAFLGVVWMDRLVPQDEGPYVPVEHASPALDPARDRVYVGTTSGWLYALTSGGRRLYRFNAGGSIESTPVYDPATQELFFGTEQGTLHALEAPRGIRRWTAELRGPVRTSPVASEDAVYVVTHDDEVFAVGRDDGEILWEYGRDTPGDGFAIADHAGVTLAGRSVLTAFTDGTVVSLDAATGTVEWVRDTSTEVVLDAGDRRTVFFDVDTTPVVVDDTVYVASFSGGLFALELGNGGVRWRDAARTGVVSIAAGPEGTLLLASAGEGVVRYDPDAQEPIWRRPLERGTPSDLTIEGSWVLSGSARGSFVARRLSDGVEVARFEGSAGFSAPAAVRGGLGFVLSNDGALYCFRVGPPPRTVPEDAARRGL